MNTDGIRSQSTEGIRTQSTNGVRTQSLAKGALAGLIGGLAGAAAKAAAEKVFLPQTGGQQVPPLLLVEKVESEKVDAEKAGVGKVSAEPEHPLSRLRESAANSATRWILGGLMGAAYGVAVEMSPDTAAWQGAAFGLALNRIHHEGALPALGLSANQQTTQERYGRRATYVVFGVVTELVRRVVRSGL